MKDIFLECRKLLPPLVTEGLWLPYLAPALDAGMATFFAEEMFEAVRYLDTPEFYTKTEDPLKDNIWLGAADDVIFRKRGVEFVDGTAPGFAAIMGRPQPRRLPARSPWSCRRRTSISSCTTRPMASTCPTNWWPTASRWVGTPGWSPSARATPRRSSPSVSPAGWPWPSAASSPATIRAT